MYKFILPIGLLLTLAACSKNDSSSPAHTTDAADAYAGNWKVTDSVHYFSSPNMPDEAHTNTGSITKTGNTGIRLNNFFTYLCPQLNANVTASSMAPINDSVCNGYLFPGDFVATKTGTTVTFSYTVFGNTAAVHGKAEKQ